ncbi:GNAT family N-acetyltransferase [Coleofasciculus sp. LEGE 07092]|uniref:GNAT family N-acetyltransferase n=1 Tax=Coleofasciculus sp. LEGE 07092 TaxID=2777969 RepID=UPI00187E0F6B|nr:N-acetyltransferase [Coleofasciculus sp. LEGE 07092]MBE9127661.1 GNAT family N-acetyltransferase [Coleofasciculus sp. LEGE 07081]MBE9150999.1 GNAT family N-acetyltransferase [Coleofasciculus sp. LEGE 07092]
MTVNPCFSGVTPYSVTSTNQDAFAVGASHITIRTAQDLDLTALAKILADSFHPRKGFLRWVHPILRLGIYEDLRNRLRGSSPHYTCFVAVTATSGVAHPVEKLTGTVEVALRSSPSWQFPNRRYPYISNLAVKKSCRRQGIAQQLLLECERKSLEWGFADIYLHVLEDNYQARQLYLKMGYKLRQIEPNCSVWLLPRPKRLFLHKPLTSTP